jgi:dipeptidyl aminopeptidase/acylaminoacyl peptidase
MQPSDIEHLAWVSDPQLSPDGTQAAYVVTRVDKAANRYRSRVWLIDADGKSTPRPISAGEETDGSPRWAPDGRSIAFTSTRLKDEKGRTRSSLYLLATDGPGEASLLCDRDEGIGQLAFSPDGSMISFASRVRGEHYESPEVGARKPRRIDRPMYRLNGEGMTLDRPMHVHVVPTDGSSGAIDVTPGDADFSSPAWFSDSVRILASRSDTSVRILSSDIASIDLVSGDVEVVTNGDGVYGAPAIDSRDRIACTGYDDAAVFPQNSHVGLLADSEAQPSWLTTSVDRDWLAFPVPAAPEWVGDSLRALVADQGRVSLRDVDLDGNVTEVVGGDRWVLGWSSVDSTVAFVAENPTHAAELFIVDENGERRLTNVTRTLTRGYEPIPAERFTAVSGDAEVDAWIYRPADFDPSKQYPMLLNIHGGPFTQYGDFFYDEAQMEARAGFVVVFANPRGSSGRDNDWGRAIRGKALDGAGWGAVDYDDCMAVVDAALEQFPFIDADRMGVLGGSYGGYMTSWIIGHTDRFAAACSERGVNNLLTLDLTSDIAGVCAFWFGESALDNAAELLRMSPISYADEMTTPLLIVHSDQDLRCPHEQADQLFYALKERDREVEYYLFPEETHELSRSGSPTHRVQRAELILEFFSRHLQPEPTDASV